MLQMFARFFRSAPTPSLAPVARLELDGEGMLCKEINAFVADARARLEKCGGEFKEPAAHKGDLEKLALTLSFENRLEERRRIVEAIRADYESQAGCLSSPSLQIALRFVTPTERADVTDKLIKTPDRFINAHFIFPALFETARDPLERKEALDFLLQTEWGYFQLRTAVIEKLTRDEAKLFFPMLEKALQKHVNADSNRREYIQGIIFHMRRCNLLAPTDEKLWKQAPVNPYRVSDWESDSEILFDCAWLDIHNTSMSYFLDPVLESSYCNSFMSHLLKKAAEEIKDDRKDYHHAYRLLTKGYDKMDKGKKDAIRSTLLTAFLSVMTHNQRHILDALKTIWVRMTDQNEQAEFMRDIITAIKTSRSSDAAEKNQQLAEFFMHAQVYFNGVNQRVERDARGVLSDPAFSIPPVLVDVVSSYVCRR